MSIQHASASASEIVTALSALLRQARHLVHRQGMNPPGVPSYALALLGAVSRCGPMRLSDIAAENSVDPSVISRQVAALENAGLLCRSTHPQDRRATLLAVTDEGRQTLAGLAERRAAFLEAAIARWSPQDVDTLAGLLTRLVEDIHEAAATGVHV